VIPSKGKVFAVIHLVGTAAGFVIVLILGLACVTALFTGEIGFGRSHALVHVDTHPGPFWVAFLIQSAIAAFAIPGIWRELRRRYDAVKDVGDDGANS
jgi:hypothetical protein